MLTLLLIDESSQLHLQLMLLTQTQLSIVPAAAAAAKSLQSSPTLCNPMDFSLPGSSVHGIFQARVLEWVAISFSRGSSPQDRTQVSHIAGGRFTAWATREALKVKVKVSQLCPTLQAHRLYSPWDSPGQNTGVGSCSLLQGIFPAQGLHPGLPNYRQIL